MNTESNQPAPMRSTSLFVNLAMLALVCLGSATLAVGLIAPAHKRANIVDLILAAASGVICLLSGYRFVVEIVQAWRRKIVGRDKRGC